MTLHEVSRRGGVGPVIEKCGCCGVELQYHDGLFGTCAKLQQTRKDLLEAVSLLKSSVSQEWIEQADELINRIMTEEGLGLQKQGPPRSGSRPGVALSRKETT